MSHVSWFACDCKHGFRDSDPDVQAGLDHVLKDSSDLELDLSGICHVTVASVYLIR